ncbi:hypothetical protein [Caenibius sp. WL]|uniref:hypothetical protein n=1 Tax=Caenibius sp. WL TaxID=2872646 RepID=UPI001C9A16E8|nr:hypothetical protein [Caenibius sp. WL]QZP07086.1 hypothetical protein K5X80_10230 [Caenibius sp. WL]
MAINDTDTIPMARWRTVSSMDTPQGQADLKLIVDACYEAILRCDDPAVRWQAVKLLQQVSSPKGTLQ